jgi:hypothetical protein
MKILFYTSVGMLIGTCKVMIYSQNPIKIVCISGVTTSLLNHGTNNNYYLRFLDRIVIMFSAVLYMFYLNDIYNKILLYTAISSYFLSKITKVIYFHIFSHFLYIIFHNNLLKI